MPDSFASLHPLQTSYRKCLNDVWKGTNNLQVLYAFLEKSIGTLVVCNYWPVSLLLPDLDFCTPYSKQTSRSWSKCGYKTAHLEYPWISQTISCFDLSTAWEELLLKLKPSMVQVTVTCIWKDSHIWWHRTVPTSTKCRKSTCVPQGSMLDPLLFSFYNRVPSKVISLCDFYGPAMLRTLIVSPWSVSALMYLNTFELAKS